MYRLGYPDEYLLLRRVASVACLVGLFRYSAAWASLCACTALGAYFRVDVVDIAFGDSSHRALVLASATSDTVVRNYVSHTYIKLVCSCLVLLSSTKDGAKVQHFGMVVWGSVGFCVSLSYFFVGGMIVGMVALYSWW